MKLREIRVLESINNHLEKQMAKQKESLPPNQNEEFIPRQNVPLPPPPENPTGDTTIGRKTATEKPTRIRRPEVSAAGKIDSILSKLTGQQAARVLEMVNDWYPPISCGVAQVMEDGRT